MTRTSRNNIVFVAVMCGCVLLSSCTDAAVQQELSDEQEVQQHALPPPVAVPQISAEEFSVALQQYPILVVEFYMKRCGSCQKMAPVYDAIAQEFQRFNVMFVKIQYDTARDIAKEYSVQWVPAVLFFHQGILVDRQVGYKDYEEFYAWIDKLIPQQ